jgi:hypothetical protein
MAQGQADPDACTVIDQKSGLPWSIGDKSLRQTRFSVPELAQ